MAKKISAEEQKLFEQAIIDLSNNRLLTVEYIEKAAEQGVDFNFFDDHGLNPLHKIFVLGNKDLFGAVKALVKHGVDVNVGIKKINVTPLLLSIEHKDIMVFLLEAGANPNVMIDRDFTGLTLLAESAGELSEEAEIDAVKVLIKAGALVSLKNDKGQTALDIAKEKDKTEMVALLEDALKKEIKAEQELKDKQKQKEQRHQENVKQALGRTTPKPRRRQKFN